MLYIISSSCPFCLLLIFLMGFWRSSPTCNRGVGSLLMGGLWIGRASLFDWQEKFQVSVNPQALSQRRVLNRLQEKKKKDIKNTCNRLIWTGATWFHFVSWALSILYECEANAVLQYIWNDCTDYYWLKD